MSNDPVVPALTGPQGPEQPGTAVVRQPSVLNRLPRLICSQNPFYLLSVCFVIHGTAQWFHRDNGAAFAPWPLMGLIAGYIAVLATTGFVIVRFGLVWDDARSILLLILLLFVELSLIFDETLVRDPQTGRWLLLAGLGFSAVLSELLLRGLCIRLPWLFRIPYHLLLCLLFLYPFWLVVPGVRLSAVTVGWRVLLFPVAASFVLLTLLPAIRRGPELTRENGTPWLWPWYPWSLFVFLGVCVGFRAYSLTLSFDAVLGSSLTEAMAFDSIFGTYFLVPLVLAIGVLLLEIGLVSKLNGPVSLAMSVPLIGLFLSFPSTSSTGAYDEFLSRLIHEVGSPIWLTLFAAIVYYLHAMMRGVKSAEFWLVLMLAMATRVDSSTIHLFVPSAPQSWPLALLAILELSLGLRKWQSPRVFFGLILVSTLAYFELKSQSRLLSLIIPASLLLTSVLCVGLIFRDEFARLLREVGAPLIIAAMVATIGAAHLSKVEGLPAWSVTAVGVILVCIAIGYSVLAQMKVYRLMAYLTGSLGTLELTVRTTVLLIHDSNWGGALSFAIGLGWFVIAVLISSWKAGWLQGLVAHIRALTDNEARISSDVPSA